MPQMTRRALLRSTALIPVSALLACHGPSPAPSQWQQDAQLIAKGLQGLIPVVASLTGIQPATVARYSNDVAVLVGLAGDIAANLTVNPATTVQRFESAVNVAVGDLAASTGILPTSVTVVLSAAAALLPAIEAAVGLIIPHAATIVMSPDAARLVLLGAAK